PNYGLQRGPGLISCEFPPHKVKQRPLMCCHVLEQDLPSSRSEGLGALEVLHKLLEFLLEAPHQIPPRCLRQLRSQNLSIRNPVRTLYAGVPGLPDDRPQVLLGLAFKLLQYPELPRLLRIVARLGHRSEESLTIHLALKTLFQVGLVLARSLVALLQVFPRHAIASRPQYRTSRSPWHPPPGSVLTGIAGRAETF